jgi:hypothetical protein
MRHPLVIAGLCLVPLFWCGTGQAQSTTPHQFTDKAGKALEATLLGISPDRRTMKIRRVDGQEFELVITLLSLEDQQYLQDWLAQQSTAEVGKPTATSPATPAASAYRVELTIDRKVSAAKKFKISSDYNIERRENISTATVRNLSRELLVGATLEWVVVWRNDIEPIEQDDGTWSYRSLEDLPEAVAGKTNLDPIPFNREVVLPISPIFTDTFDYGSSSNYKDTWDGTIARVNNADGTMIVEIRGGSGDITTMTWEKAIALVPKPDDGN